jgi:glycosyltransferase involved in cell wall biosynthesis
VIDDGSSDDSPQILRSYESSRIKIITQDHSDAPAARNKGLSVAQGKYLQFIDADDLLSPTKIEDQMRIFIQRQQDDIVTLSRLVYFFDGEIPSEGRLDSGFPFVDADNTCDWFIKLLDPESPGMAQTGVWLCPRAIIEKSGPWLEGLRVNMDGEFYARVVMSAAGIRLSKPGVAYYRKFKRSRHRPVSARLDLKSAISLIRAVDIQKEWLLRRNDTPGAKEAIARQYLYAAYKAYPTAPNEALEAVRKSRALYETDYFSGGEKGKLLRKMLGWENARKLSLVWHRLKDWRGYD